jgi:hypothetical protein
MYKNFNIIMNADKKVYKSKKKIEKEELKNITEINNKIQVIKEEITDEVNQTNSDVSDIIEIVELKPIDKIIYNNLKEFYIKLENIEVEKIISIINGEYKISLRFMDWFVTRYCYLYKTSIVVNNRFIKESSFNVNINYKAQLKSYKKKRFDPFRRKKKFYFSINDKKILTTIGQLNFFKWAITNDIIAYCENNYELINSKVDHVNKYFKKNIIENSSDSSNISNSNNNIYNKIFVEL